ncbi:ribbon-helix-helix protein, CopG family [Streptacidiphilus monticola]|jgi:predicted transcriptional regulator|uniref:Ribbon-helix-helix protein, CopG family n=1 Tax=Streptacidiphilus monticola TaxID=2161674 RepID=A0ABW1FY55_9ACTN
MAMNLRLRDDLNEALRERAEAEGVSMHAIVVTALEEYLARTTQQAMVRRTALEQAAKWRELMERLK